LLFHSNFLFHVLMPKARCFCVVNICVTLLVNKVFEI
jgi:hypothetical protein